MAQLRSTGNITRIIGLVHYLASNLVAQYLPYGAWLPNWLLVTCLFFALYRFSVALPLFPLSAISALPLDIHKVCSLALEEGSVVFGHTFRATKTDKAMSLSLWLAN